MKNCQIELTRNAQKDLIIKEKGFNNINLVTSAFQAPEFYKKCGFTLEFVKENKVNPKLTKFFFVKYFKNQIQTQGMLKTQ